MKVSFRWNSLPFAVVASALLVAGFMSSASATPVILFEDDFNRPNANTVNFGWVEQQNQGNDVRIFDQHLEIKDDSPLQGAATQPGISTVGFGNISFLFDLVAIVGTDSLAEELLVQWKQASDGSFLTLDTIDISAPTATLASFSYALPDSADDEYRHSPSAERQRQQ